MAAQVVTGEGGKHYMADFTTPADDVCRKALPDDRYEISINNTVDTISELKIQENRLLIQIDNGDEAEQPNQCGGLDCWSPS